MVEKIIKTKKGLYGRVNVTLPLPVKYSLMDFQKRSGYKKAEFMRLALMTGYISLTKSIEDKDQSEVSEIQLSQLPART
ncbi:MAG: hypothetical protein A2X25_09260 [Chloroflexi bacterium GWB2_49_20]|nr:MAG: hypothetical protein A2X25_09260 [Chloroflexi bacterium GWB2_49_20]OGN79385.1 MAG: hypothetical protein A2X26_04765 [Chloroflexi bacterium GWC2_49_37]OGN82845.1 MAG: hypothetical protein A2X27_07930 [Chloroflexi bacterium GWD2_49_16]HCC78495.1 hypothetical protein [Anaerolineae bacterium]HCM97320.1 hypothetical protein [Anaerolineae bacterium]